MISVLCIWALWLDFCHATYHGFCYTAFGVEQTNLTIIELTMWPCVCDRACVCACVRACETAPITADVTVTKITGYVRVRILMNRWLFRIFGIQCFYATATLLNIWISMQWTDAADGGCGGGLDFAPMHAILSVGQCDVNISSLSPRGKVGHHNIIIA